MNDIFYYAGFFFIIDSIISFFRKSDVPKVFEDFNNSVDDFKKGFVPSTNHIKKYDLITSISYFTWVILGVIFSELRIYFIILFFLTFTLAFIVSKTEKSKMKISSKISTIINILFVLTILYKHFIINQ